MRRFRQQILLVLGAICVVAVAARLTEQPRMAPLVGEQMWTPGVEFVDGKIWGGVYLRGTPGHVTLTLDHGKFEIFSDHHGIGSYGTYKRQGDTLILNEQNWEQPCVLTEYGRGFIEYGYQWSPELRPLFSYEPTDTPGTFRRKTFCFLADPPPTAAIR